MWSSVDRLAVKLLIVSGTPVPWYSTHKFAHCTSAPACPTVLFPSCILTPISGGKIGFHLPSRFVGGGILNGKEGKALAWNRKRSGYICSASSDEDESNIDSLLSSSFEDISRPSAERTRENKLVTVIRAVGQFVTANFVIVALFSSVSFGLTWPAPGKVAHQMGLTKWCTAGIFVLSGLALRTGDIDKAAAAWPALIFGLVSILLVTPLASIPILTLHSLPREIASGLAIFACVPTTLSSGVSLTQIAGANAALALGITVISNLISILTMPFTLTTFIGGAMGVSIPPGPLLKSLIQSLLLPLLLGKALRETFSGVAKIVDENRRQISRLTISVQALGPWMQLSCSRAKLLQIEHSSLLILAASGLALHITYLATNLLLMKLWPSSSIHEDFNSRAVLLVASQKSILVSIAVIDRLEGVFGCGGLLVLPCIAGQLSQVIIDSILVNHWLQSDAKKQVRPLAV